MDRNITYFVNSYTPPDMYSKVQNLISNGKARPDLISHWPENIIQCADPICVFLTAKSII